MLKINILPASAGTTKLINQAVTDVNKMPKLFVVNIPISCKDTLPLIPRSAKAMVGTMASVKNKRLTLPKSKAGDTSMSNNLKSKIYFITKTR